MLIDNSGGIQNNKKQNIQKADS